MEEKLVKLYYECINELYKIGIDMNNEKLYGKIYISIYKRKVKRYGACRQEQPDKKTKYKENGKIYYGKYLIHNIEISSWLMELNDEIIKNTIMHELIHCLPYCNNHGKNFKQYASLINDKLGYEISRVGNKSLDYQKSNLEFDEKSNNRIKYIVLCEKCGQKFYRQRLIKNFSKKYRCGKCGGKFKIIDYNELLLET